MATVVTHDRPSRRITTAGSFTGRIASTRIPGLSILTSRGPLGVTTRVRGRTGISTIVPSRSRTTICPGEIEAITPRSTRKSCVPPKRSATTTSDRTICGPNSRSISARGRANAALGEPEEHVDGDENRREQGEASPGHTRMIVQGSDEDVKPA